MRFGPSPPRSMSRPAGDGQLSPGGLVEHALFSSSQLVVPTAHLMDPLLRLRASALSKWSWGEVQTGCFPSETPVFSHSSTNAGTEELLPVPIYSRLRLVSMAGGCHTAPPL